MTCPGSSRSSGSNDLVIIRGDDQCYNLKFQDENEDDIDITGWKIYFTVKINATDSDDAAVLKIDTTVHTNPTQGKTSFTVTHVQSNTLLGVYSYDIQAKKLDGSIVTVLVGRIEFTEDITRRIT
jgi:hypothetical protein